MLDFLSNLGKSNEEKLQEAVTAYLDDALTPQQRERFEQEIRADVALHAEVAQQRLIKERMGQLPRQRAPRNFSLDPALYGKPAPAPRLYPALRTATALVAIFFVIAVVANLLTFSGGAPRPIASFSEAVASQELALEAVGPEMEMAPPVAPAIGESAADEALTDSLSEGQEVLEAPAEAIEEVVEGEAAAIIVEAEESMPAEEILADEAAGAAESNGAMAEEESAPLATKPESADLLQPSEAESPATAVAGGALLTPTSIALATPMEPAAAPAEPQPPVDDTQSDRSALPPTSSPVAMAEAPPTLDTAEKALPTQPALAEDIEEEPELTDQSGAGVAEQLQVDGRQPLPLLRIMLVFLAVAVILLSAATLIARSRQ